MNSLVLVCSRSSSSETTLNIYPVVAYLKTAFTDAKYCAPTPKTGNVTVTHARRRLPFFQR